MRLLDGDLVLSTKDLERFKIYSNYRFFKHREKNLPSYATNSGNWQNVSIDGVLHVYYDTIPPKSKQKLPAKEELILEIENQKKKPAEIAAKAAKSTVLVAIDKALNTEHVQWLEHYEDEFPKEAIELAKAASLLSYVVSIYDQYGQFPKVYEIIQHYKLRYFKTNSEQYVRRLVNNVFKKEQELGFFRNTNVLAEDICIRLHIEAIKSQVHPPRIGNQSGKKYEQWHEDYIGAWLCHGNKFTDWQIADRVNALALMEERLPVNERYVKYIRQKLGLSVYGQRHGGNEFKRKVRPYINRKLAIQPFDLWQIDGTKLQLLYKDETGKPSYVVFYCVYDVYSRAIVGWSIAKSEDYIVVIESLMMAVNRFRTDDGFRCAVEIVHDNSSAHKKDEIKHLKTVLESAGIEFRAAPVGCPEYKANLERCFGTFQTRWLKQSPYYIGEGIKSRRINAHPNPDVLQKLAKSTDLLDFEGLRQHLAELIQCYNADAIKSNASSPLQRLQEPAEYARFLEPWRYAFAFLPTTSLKVKHGMVKMRLRGQEFQFMNLSNPNAVANLEARNVTVKYNPSDLSKVWVFAENYREEWLLNDPITIGRRATEEDQKKLGSRVSEIKNYEQQLSLKGQYYREKLNEMPENLFDFRLLHKDKLNDMELQLEFPNIRTEAAASIEIWEEPDPEPDRESSKPRSIYDL